MQPLEMIVTAAGLDALVDAQNGETDPIRIAEIGLTETAFVAAPTLEALPGEIARIGTVSGQSIAPNVIHMTAQDSSNAVYDLRGLGLYLEDGTLFAAYAQADPLFRKVSIASFLFALDVAFSAAVADDIQFGDASFLYPPATETVRGVAELATEDEVLAGVDGERIVTPAALDARLILVLQAIADEEQARGDADDSFQAAINALLGRTIATNGLALGGGDLSADRTIDVPIASTAELLAAAIGNKAVTPESFAGLPRQFGSTGYQALPGGALFQRGLVRSSFNGQGTYRITFPIAFADTNFDLQLTTVIPGAGNYDNYFQEINGTRSSTGVTVFAQDPSGGESQVLSGFNWRAEGRLA